MEKETKHGLVSHAFAGIAGGLFVILVTVVYLLRYGLPVNLGSLETKREKMTSIVRTVDATDIVSKANPAVVSIIITQEVPKLERYFEDPFGDFFGGSSPFSFRIPRYRQNGTEEREVGGGSGFIISEDGYIVTNAHVVSNEDSSYTVYVNDETSYEAEVIARDTALDIALLKIDAEDLPFLTFGDSDTLRLGQAVIAIGNALGEFRNTVSTGVISGLSRSITAGDGFSAPEQLENVIQTDAAINPGNSGGPLLDFEGHVVGVNVAVARGSENIGFSLPSNAVSSAIDSMKEHGRVIRPRLGVRYIPVTKSVREKNDLDVDHGALILRGTSRDELAVLPGSPADKGGLEEYDIILEIDGQKIDEKHSLASVIRSKRVGETVTLKILHEGTEKTLRVTLDEAGN